MFNDLPPGFRVVSQPAQPAQAQAPVSDIPPGFRVVSAPQPAAAPAMPAGPRAEDRNFIQRNFSDPVGRGFNRLQQGVSSVGYQTGFTSPEDYAAALLRDEQDMAQYPVQPEMQARVQRIADSDGIMQGLGRGLMDPGAVWNVTLQSLPNMLPSLVGGVAGGLAGLPLGPVGAFAGRAAGSGAASAVTEYGNVITEMVRESGAELTEENILRALQDEALMAEADRRGKARGLGIGIWDAISFGIAGRPFSAVTSRTGSRAAGVGAELGVQAGAEGAGEATAQLLDKGEVDRKGEVALEALSGGLTGAVVEVPTALLTQPRGPDAEQSVQPPPAAPGPGVPPATPPAGSAPLGADSVAGPSPVPAGQPVEGSDGAAFAGGGSAPDPAANQPGAVPAQAPPAPGQGQPAPAAQPANPRRREVTYGDNQRIETDFELVEMDDLVAASGDLQPRDRTRDTSDEQIAQIAGNLDPSRLLDSAEADRGAPIIGPDNVIESGNGRIQALRRAAEMFPERYEAYRQAVLDSGFAEANDQLRKPVLVRRRVTPFDDNQRREFVVGANRPATLAMSATERAKADRDALTDDVLDRLVPDASAGLRAGANRDFVRAFVSRLPQTERGALLDANGQLSQEGERRLQGAILTRAYGDDGTVAQQLEATDDNAKAISGALLDAAGAWAQLVRATKAGDVKPEFDTTKDLMRAVAIVRQARESGEKVLDLVNQGDTFDPVSDTTRELVRSFFRDDALTKAAGRARVTEALTRYVREAQQQTTGPNLFGETAPPVTPADVARVARSERQASMFGGDEAPRQQAAEDAMLDGMGDDFTPTRMSPREELSEEGFEIEQTADGFLLFDPEGDTIGSPFRTLDEAVAAGRRESDAYYARIEENMEGEVEASAERSRAAKEKAERDEAARQEAVGEAQKKLADPKSFADGPPRTLGSMLRSARDTPPSGIAPSLWQPLVDRLIRAIPDIPVYMAGPDFMDIVSRAGPTDGFYNRKHKYIALRTGRAAADQNRTLVHEAIHAALYDVFSNDLRSRVSFERLLADTRAAVEARGEDGPRWMREALSNVDEFAAYALTDERFQEVLKGIEADPEGDSAYTGNLFQAFVELVRRWALKNLNVSQPRMLEAVMQSTEQAFDARNDPAPETREAPLFDDSDPFADIEADDKRRLGGLGPNMARVSQTNRGSYYENAFVAMGENPDEMRARPAGEQIARLLKFVQDTFGFASVARKGPQGEALAVDARDSLLDLYRNGQFMSHVLALPQTGLGLLGTLSINFERDKSRYFGAYYPGEKMIALPGRTNSFAHEWMHALDHFLNEKLNGRPEMLSRLARDEGLDTAKTLEGAFVNVLNALFFDRADVAQRMLTLQAEASEVATRGPNKGNPTQKALNAQAQIEKLARGNSRIRGADSKYAQRVKDFADGNPYWTNPAEMIARAFEAYVAMKVEADGGTNEVITKGNEAYLSDADARLRDTFPKSDDRANIFRAFDELFDVLRDAEILGVGVAPKPDDHGTLQPNYWAKQAAARLNPPLLARLKSEGSRIINLLTLDRGTREEFMEEMRDRVGMAPAGSPPPRVPLRRRMVRNARTLYWSMRSMMHAAVDRNGDAGVWGREFIVDKLATDPGRGRAIGETFEEAAERYIQKWNNRLEAAVEAAGVPLERRSPEQIRRLRALALGDDRRTVKGATDAEVKLAAELRRILDELFREAQKAGIDVNFVGETIGYLKRTIQREAVFDNPGEFVKQATKVYEIMFDQEVGNPADVEALAAKLRTIAPGDRSPALVTAVQRMRDLRRKINALSKQLETSTDPDQVQARIDALIPDLDEATAEVAELTREAWSRAAAKDWLDRLRVGSPMDFDTRGPDSQFTQSRTLPDEADTLLADFYMTDPIDTVVDYLQSAGRKIKFVERFGAVMGNDKIENVARRNAKAIERSPRRYSLSTSEGRRNILRDFGDRRLDSFGGIALMEMGREGAEPSDIALIKDYWEMITGRKNGPGGPIGQIATAIYATGTLALLPRAVWASVAEPVTVYLRTGSGKAALTLFATLVREIFRNAKSTQELAAFSELIGNTGSAYSGAFIMNRLSLNQSDNPGVTKLLANFFRRTGLTQLTNAQRRAALPAGWVFLRILAEKTTGQNTNLRDKKLAERELLELGVPAESLSDFAGFVRSNEKLPSLDDMVTPAGEIAATALVRLVNEIIQNPTRVDKPYYTGTPIGRLAYGIMSFSYKFFRSTVLRSYYGAQTRAEVNREVGMSRTGAAAEAYASVALQFATGAAALVLGQMLVSIAREAVFNGDRWEEKEKKDELAPWLLQLGFSRSGLIGPADVLVQAYTGLRYQRDLTSLYAGPHIGYFMGQAQKIAAAAGPNNSPNSNVQEWNAVKAGYQMLAVPALSVLLTALPGGPVTGPLAGLALQGVTSNKAADSFTTAVVGEKDTRRDP